LPFLSLTGKTPTKERGNLVQRFQAQEVPILLLSLKAGGNCGRVVNAGRRGYAALGA